MRVLIADDHPLYRDAVVRTVKHRPDLELVGEAADGRAALESIRALAPDVAVLDLRMPELDGLQVLNALQREQRPTRVLVLSAFLESALIFDAVAAGAAAYLSKDADRDRIADTIAAVARGETVLPAEVHAALAEQIRARGRPERPTLSERESEVLRLVAEGLSAPEIGRRLHLSAATVKSHLQSLYDKLGVSERAAAVAEAMRRGLLE